MFSRIHQPLADGCSDSLSIQPLALGGNSFWRAMRHLLGIGAFCGISRVNKSAMKYCIAARKRFFDAKPSVFDIYDLPFNSRKEALARLRELERQPYLLARDEASRPTLKVVPKSQLTQRMKQDISWHWPQAEK